MVEVSELSLFGAHNLENAMAAAAAALTMGLPRDAVAEGLRSFAGVPHRLERIAEIDGVLYVNDSKATNVAAASAALRSFDGGVRAILGGSLKGGGFADLAEPVAERCVACYLIGEAAERLEPRTWQSSTARRSCCGASAASRTAVRAAAVDAIAGEVVLLAPACASFDAIPRLRGARRALPLAGGGAAMSAVAAGRASRLLKGPRAKRGAPPVEYSILLTATLCLVAFGIVMVFSASSTTSLLGESGDSAYYLKRTLIFGAFGLVALKVLSMRGVAIVRPLTGALLAISFVLLIVVHVPGVGVEANGATRWISLGFLQVQPAEIAKISLILYGAHLLATRPKITADLRLLVPYLSVVGVVCALIVFEPDLGTAMVASLAVAALLVAAGVKLRHLAMVAGAIAVLALLMIAIEPYRMERLTGFLNPGADAAGAGFQGTQASIALGSGGLFGVGLGESVQKAFYLPEAHTDMIAAVIGEELGLVGMSLLLGLFVLFGYAGFRTAQRAARPLPQAARRGTDRDDPDPGDDQPVRGDGTGAADRGAAAVRLLWKLEPAGDARRGRPLAQHRQRACGGQQAR